MITTVRRHLASLGIAALVGLSPASAWSNDGRIAFHARVSDLVVQIDNPLIAGKAPDDEIVVTVDGALFDPPRRIPAAQIDAASYDSPEAALASSYGANLAGDVDWMARDFVVEERAELKEFFADAEMLEANRGIFASLTGMSWLGQVELGDYLILLVRYDRPDGSGSPLPVTFRKTQDGWKRTNALKADPRFDVIFSALRTGRFQVVR